MFTSSSRPSGLKVRYVIALHEFSGYLRRCPGQKYETHFRGIRSIEKGSTAVISSLTRFES